jgi:hypothetical protein
VRDAGCGFSLGFSITTEVQMAVLAIPADAWVPAYDLDGQPRKGAWVAEITDMLDLTKWPTGSRVILRRERPHPGAQLRFTDSDGHRFTAFITDTTGGQLADLEVHHRSHARVEDRIRCGKATGLRNVPCRGYAENKAWLELALTAADLLTWAKRSVSPATSPAANPRRCATGSAPSPRNSLALPASGRCIWTGTGPGPSISRTPSPGSAQHPGQTDSRLLPLRPRTLGTRPPTRQPAHNHAHTTDSGQNLATTATSTEPHSAKQDRG